MREACASWVPWVAALTMTACGAAEDLPGALDAGVVRRDAGALPSPDASASFDAGVSAPDAAGWVDAGSTRDASTGSDAGVLPVGVEGAACTPSPDDPRGSCIEVGLECMTWSPAGALSPVSTCIRRCAADRDCAASRVGNVCASVRLDQQACVAAASSQLGETVTVSGVAGSLAMGCAAPLVAVPPTAGSLLVGLSDTQASCGRLCGGDGACDAAAPFCALGAIAGSSSTASGLCQVRSARKGARCSLVRADEMCDSTSSEHMACMDLGVGVRGDDRYGTCVELCTASDPSCMAEVDAAHPPTCSLDFFASNVLGICSDGCSAHPNDCTNAASTPVAGQHDSGATCLELGGTVEEPAAALCIDVAQDAEVLALGAECRGDELRCPRGTTCASTTTPEGQASSACLAGCSTETATTSCAAFGGTACVAISEDEGPGYCALP